LKDGPKTNAVCPMEVREEAAITADQKAASSHGEKSGHLIELK
jgi:hypothetical protein